MGGVIMAYKQPLVTGTWIPTLSFGGSTTGITYSSQTGAYTQIGNIVFLQGRIILSSKGVQTGVAAINTLPFSASQTCELNLRVSNTTFTGYLTLETSGTSIFPINTVSAGTGAQLTDTAFANNSLFIFAGVYITAST